MVNALCLCEVLGMLHREETINTHAKCCIPLGLSVMPVTSVSILASSDNVLSAHEVNAGPLCGATENKHSVRSSGKITLNR